MSRSTTTCELRRTDAADGRLNARTDADRFGRSGPPGRPSAGRAPGRAKTLAFLAKLPITVLFFRSPGGLSPKPRVAIFFIGEGGGDEPAEDEAVGAGAIAQAGLRKGPVSLREAGVLFDAEGAPLNPRGRTGMKGRGLLGKWGPNHAADPIVTRYNPDTELLEVVEAAGAGSCWSCGAGLHLIPRKASHNNQLAAAQDV